MSFDWPRFLDSSRIEYITKGHGSTSGTIVVHCPFCGASDEGTHMAISINGRGWRCLRHPDMHKGRDAARLIAALTGCSLVQAARICGEQVHIPEDFMGRIDELLKVPEFDNSVHVMHMPLELRQFSLNKPSCRPYIQYLKKRGFREIKYFTHLLDVRYAVSGFFHHRVVIPIRFNSKLVSLTGRSLDPHAGIRYLTLPTDPEKCVKYGLEPAIGPITDYLLWHDECHHADADTIVLVEGPLDAFKVWQLGLDEGIVSTCFFTATASPAQIDTLHSLLPKFKRRYLLLDNGTLSTSMRLQQQLYGLEVINKILPQGIKDPGDIQDTDQLVLSLR